jgi:hypothetical protein
MKGEFFIVVVGLFLALGIGVLVVGGLSFSGYAILDVENNIEENDSFTREDALQSLNESREIINEMERAGFSGRLVDDLLIEGEKVFQQVEYAEVLRMGSDATNRDRAVAANALEFVDWRFIDYSDILVYTDEIAETRELAFLVQDLLSIQESLLGAERNESGDIISFSKVDKANLERFRFLTNEI